MEFIFTEESYEYLKKRIKELEKRVSDNKKLNHNVTRQNVEDYAKELYDTWQLNMTPSQYEQFINHLCEMFNVKD